MLQALLLHKQFKYETNLPQKLFHPIALHCAKEIDYQQLQSDLILIVSVP